MLHTSLIPGHDCNGWLQGVEQTCCLLFRKGLLRAGAFRKVLLRAGAKQRIDKDKGNDHIIHGLL